MEEGKSLTKQEEAKGKSRLINSSSEAQTRPAVLGEAGDEVEDDGEDGPRMGELIREAMPCRLARAPSLPSSKIRKEVVAAEAGRARGGAAIAKLTRRSSMDPSLILLAKNIAKTKGPASSKLNRNVEPKTMPRPKNLERSMSLKSLSDKEVQGFQELGFAFDKEDLSSSVAAKFDSLQIKKEPAMAAKSSAEDIKEQLKFWARSVASNMN